MMDFNMDTGVFEGLMTIDTGIKSSTTLYTNLEYYYRTGRKVTLMVDEVELKPEQVQINEMEEYFFDFEIIDTELNGKTLKIKVESTPGEQQIVQE